MEVDENARSCGVCPNKGTKPLKYQEEIDKIKNTETIGKLLLEMQQSDKEGEVTVVLTKMDDSILLETNFEGERTADLQNETKLLSSKKSTIELFVDEKSISEPQLTSTEQTSSQVVLNDESSCKEQEEVINCRRIMVDGVVEDHVQVIEVNSREEPQGML